MNELAIEIKNLKKQYRLGQIGGETLNADLRSWWARVRGKEDPNARIGQEDRLVGQTFMALNGIDLRVKKGEAIGIIGGNGAGKSTMLKILSRVTAPTEGVVGINGRVASMLEVGTGFNSEMTGRENIYLNGTILGMTREEINAKMEDIIEFSEVRDFIDTPVKRYSSGMYVKLAFSVAAHLDAEIMIMDEVLAVGDMAFQQKCLQKMRDAATVEGKTVLYVSHNMHTIRQLCDRCVVLEQGRVIFDGNVETAIGIYLQTADEAQNPEKDLTHRDRPKKITKQAEMQYLRYLNCDACTLSRGENLTFLLRWKANADLENVKFRMVVLNKEDAPVGLTQSDAICSVKKDEIVETTLSIETGMLAEGKYTLDMALFQSDIVGNALLLDRVERANGIDIVAPMDETNRLNWDHRQWGSVRLPDMEIVR